MNNNIITDDYCSFEVSKLLKGKGLNIKMLPFYNSMGQLQTIEDFIELGSDSIKYHYRSLNTPEWMEEMCSAPTHSLAIKWIREKYGIHIWTRKSNNSDMWFWRLDGSDTDWKIPDDRFSFPEEATEAAFLYTLKHLIK